MQQRVIKSCLLHVPSTLPPFLPPRSLPAAFPWPPPLPPIRTSLRCLFFCLPRPSNAFLFNSFFFLVSDGSSDSSPPVSPPRARKGEYSSRLRYKAYNVIIDPIRYMCARCITKIYFFQVYYSIFASISFYIMNRFLSKIPRE